jgi:hypothetical protein
MIDVKTSHTPINIRTMAPIIEPITGRTGHFTLVRTPLSAQLQLGE